MNIGILGTGLMGAPMALRLLESGMTVTAYNRTPEKLSGLQAAGISIATSPISALQASEAVILMLTDAPAISDLILSEPAKSALVSRTVLQMGTISPEESQQIRDQVVAAGGEYLEATVLGSIPQVKSGTLIVMVGATVGQFEKWTPLLQQFGPEPLLMGPVGSAAAVKLAMNQPIGSLTTAFALSLGFVERTDVDVESFMQVVRQSALYAPTFDKKLQRMLTHTYDNPNFPSKHLLKDTRLFTEAARKLGLDARLTESVGQIIQGAITAGFSEADYSSLYDVVNPQDSLPKRH